MTSLPISNNKPQTPGNAANAAQANIATDAQLADTQSTDPFAFLLAQQIGVTDLPGLTAAQTAITIDDNAASSSADRAQKDAQDQAAAAADTPGDPANTLAAILLQLHAPENREQKAEDKQATQPLAISPFQKIDGQQVAQPFALSPFEEADGKQAIQPLAISPFQKTDGQQVTQPFALSPFEEADGQQAIQPLAISPFQRTKDRQAIQPSIPGPSQENGHKKPMADSEGSQIIQLPAIGHLSSEVVKRAELPSGLTQPTPNTAQAIAPSAIPAAMPSMLTNNMSADTPPTINTPLGNNGWADEFSQKISWISTQKNQVAELHLNPPNLGPLDVVLKISDNQATILFTSPHGAVRDAVENALPKLREILADNGIMLGNTTISDQSPRDRSSDGFMNQGSGTSARHEVSDIAPEPAGLSLIAAQNAPIRRHNGMVDTFA